MKSIILIVTLVFMQLKCAFCYENLNIELNNAKHTVSINTNNGLINSINSQDDKNKWVSPLLNEIYTGNKIFVSKTRAFASSVESGFWLFNDPNSNYNNFLIDYKDYAAGDLIKSVVFIVRMGKLNIFSYLKNADIMPNISDGFNKITMNSGREKRIEIEIKESDCCYEMKKISLISNGAINESETIKRIFIQKNNIADFYQFGLLWHSECVLGEGDLLYHYNGRSHEGQFTYVFYFLNGLLYFYSDDSAE